MKSRKQSVTLRLARSLGSWPATTAKHAARLETRRTALVDGNATQKSRRCWTATTAPRPRSHRAGQSSLRGATCVVHENPSAPLDTLVRGHAQRLAHRGRGLALPGPGISFRVLSICACFRMRGEVVCKGDAYNRVP